MVEKKDPRSLLIGNMHRWNHDIDYQMPDCGIQWTQFEGIKDKKEKFKSNMIKKWNSSRYFKWMTTKCIFRASKFAEIVNPHHPDKPVGDIICVDSIHCKVHPEIPILTIYGGLRENDIRTAYMVLYHYIVISDESIERKMKSSDLWWSKVSKGIVKAWDHPDVIDTTMRDKWIKYLSQDKRK